MKSKELSANSLIGHNNLEVCCAQCVSAVMFGVFYKYLATMDLICVYCEVLGSLEKKHNKFLAGRMS